MINKYNSLIRYLILILALIFMIIGLSSGELDIIYYRAVNICFECIGIG